MKYIFVGEKYSWLFCFRIVSVLAKMSGGTKATLLDTGSVELSEIERRLGMSFLGGREFFWLGDLSLLPVTIQKPLLIFLFSYAGPHQIAFFINEKKFDKQQYKNSEIILCDELLSNNEVNTLWQLIFPEFLSENFLERETYTMKKGGEKTLSLETALQKGLYLYAGGLCGGKAYAAWQPHLSVENPSLFVLAQHFFAKEQSEFLSFWHAIRDEYPSEFWIAYWSEQLWQAHAFVCRARYGDMSYEKKGNRLPFSFMQRDWRCYKPNEFTVAHAMLYGVDCALKNGCGGEGIDLFVLRFVTGSFEKVQN